MKLNNHQKNWLAKTSTLVFALAFFFQARAPLLGNEHSTDKIRDKDIVMEIFFLPHAPALRVVDKVEEIASIYEGIIVKKYDFEDPKTKKILKKYKINGHIPVAIVINGQSLFVVKGKEIRLWNFPKGDAFVPIYSGEWDYPDLHTILQDIYRVKK